MQNITPQLARGAPIIESYGGEGFRIAGSDYASSILVTPSAVHAWSVAHADDITMESLAPLFTGASPQVLLIGTGYAHTRIAPEIVMAMKSHRIACDTMDTGAACRTFNILLAEGRNASAALILPAKG